MSECFRCGWCGQPTDCDGRVLEYSEIVAQVVDWDKAESTHGDCCIEEQTNKRIVTREMAIDAQDPDLEGTEY